MKIRPPRQAGSFYADTAELLRRQIEECFLHRLGPGQIPNVIRNGPRKILGLICPHAGFVFSGPVAAHAYYRLALDGKPDVILLLGPNHTGRGSGLSVMIDGFWRTPLGDVEVNTELANKIAHQSQIIDVDDTGHQFEHSLEVQLPFLQYLYGSGFKIVPISFLMQDLSTAREVGNTIADALGKINFVIIASSDMTHYQTHEKAERNDLKALEAVKAMDEAKLYSVIREHNISACGYGPIASLVTAAKILKTKDVKLLCYKTSGDVTGDHSSVVGYAALSFTK
ncbi:MAG: AmmeMemoRadiSam system protein B [Candidatus Bathyarchaeota archaeon]